MLQLNSQFHIHKALYLIIIHTLSSNLKYTHEVCISFSALIEK